MFPNLDVTNTVEIFATFKEEDGKKKTGKNSKERNNFIL
jgi:hypothetical protein